MQHWNWRLFASILLLSMLIAVSIAQQRHTTRTPSDLNVILIGWDGAGRERVRQCLQQGELPHLAQLASEGKLVAIDILRTTDTKAGWTQILTGYEPEKTGVYSNARYQPIPPGYTLFERLEQHFGKDHIATVAVMGKRGTSTPTHLPRCWLSLLSDVRARDVRPRCNGYGRAKSSRRMVCATS
ncbi:MAG: alkaline phosphatase family protein [Armatimonadota bacterium]|nr:alkaline phosphatase family protein [Armatimonadota bacterium]